MCVQVLVVEDNLDISELLYINLTHAGLKCMSAENTYIANLALNSNKIDIIILDWMLPKQSGLSFLKELKSNFPTQHIPVIMLTARQAEEDTIKALEAGADDYIHKPFSPKELVARVKRIVKRLGFGDNHSVGNISINSREKKAYVINNAELYEINLSPTEFKLLFFFITHTDRVYSRNELLDYVWNDSGDIDERSVDVQIKRLRKAISNTLKLNFEEESEIIETVRGFGYKMSSQK
jgi:two-component system phosphate regulon response regulator PhoB